MPLRPTSQQRRIPQTPKAGKFSNKMSLKSRTATAGVASHDVGDFDRFGFAGKPNVNVATQGESEPAAPTLNDGQQDPHGVIAQYSDLGAALKKHDTFVEVARKIAEIADMAETTVMQEAGDWFDEHTIKRNMKEMKGFAGQFSKIAEELDGLHQRAQALYDDMGNVLNRYFEIGGQQGDVPQAAGNEPSSMDRGAAGMATTGQVGECSCGQPNCRTCAEGAVNEAPDDAGRSSVYPQGPFHPALKTKPLKDWKCLECGRKMTMRAAKQAIMGDKGCPGCGGVDIDLDEGLVKEGTDLATAQKAFNLPNAIAQGLTGLTKDQAREIIKKSGAKNVREAKKALVKDVIGKQKLLLGDEPNTDDDATGFKEDCGAGEMDEADEPKKQSKATKEKRIRKAAESGPYGNVTVEGKRINFMLAQAIVALMDGLSPENKAKFLGMPIGEMMVITAKLYHKGVLYRNGVFKWDVSSEKKMAFEGFVK